MKNNLTYVENEIEARDVELRLDLPIISRKLPPFNMKGVCETQTVKIYADLIFGKITNEDAITKFTKVMEEYYGISYSY